MHLLRGSSKVVEEPLSEGARARQEVLRNLLKTAIQIGDEEYEDLLGEVYSLATRLLDESSSSSSSSSDPSSDPESSVRRHRRKGAKWDAIGFQATAPDREFRGGGMLGLHCLLYALKEGPEICRSVLKGPFPFAAASINMTMVAARLCGIVKTGCADDSAVDPLADVGGGSKSMASRCQELLETSHDGFFEVHCAALECLERARRDVDAGPMDFAGCAAAARDEVAVLLAHEPKTGHALRALSGKVPRRVSGFLSVSILPTPTDGGTAFDATTTTSMSGRTTTTSVPRPRKTTDGKTRSSWFLSSSSSSSSGRMKKTRLYVALSTGTLRWYDASDVHSHKTKDGSAENLAAFPLAAPLGTFRLRPDMSIKFKQEHATFSVYDSDDPSNPVFAAAAREPKDMERWCVALTEHVALGGGSSDNDAGGRGGGRGLAKASDDRECLGADDLTGEDGVASLQFKVVETIGIYVRSTPDVAATRTGKALMPGDVVFVTERMRVKDDKAGPRGRSFLKIDLTVTPATHTQGQEEGPEDKSKDLAVGAEQQQQPPPQEKDKDESATGWVMEHHPSTFEPILLPLDEAEYKRLIDLNKQKKMSTATATAGES